MKKFRIFLSVAVALLFAGSVAHAVNMPSFESVTDKSKDIGRQHAPVRVIKLVRFASANRNGPNVVSGDVLVYDTLSDDGVSVNHTTTSNDSTIAGIACISITTADAGATSAESDAGKRNWGWIVVHGPANAKVGAGGTNGNGVGEPFITSSDSGAVTAISGVAAATELDENGFGGFFMDAADGSSTSVEVFVKLE